MSFANRSLSITAKTWRRDSYGLYDYETTNYYAQTLNITRPGQLVRSEDEVNWSIPSLIEEDDTDSGTEYGVETKSIKPESLASLVEGPDGIRLVPNSSMGDGSKIWMTLDRGDSNSGHELQENDVIKLGRVVFKIKQICFDKDSARSSLKSPETIILDTIKSVMGPDEERVVNDESYNKDDRQGQDDKSNACCKICLGDKAELDDPLISPCKCIGSVRFVHLQCLLNWVRSKLNITQNQNILTILWKSLSCELCKSKLPIKYNHEGEELMLLPFANKMSGPYMILESFAKENEPAGIHVVDLSAKENFHIGRGHDCDLKLVDISASRVHAIMTVNKGKLYLKDNYSKFGTLILMREPFILNDSSSKSGWFQCGRTIFKVTVKKPWSAVLPCFGTLFSIGKSCESKQASTAVKLVNSEETRGRLSTKYEEGRKDGGSNQD